MRILFYVEPVIFRNDPLFLRPWLSWIGQMMRAHVTFDPAGQFAFSSNPWLCRAIQAEVPIDLALFPVAPASILRPFAMDRVAYGQDLAMPKATEPRNRPLADHISAAVKRFAPDVVISFTQNRYLAAISHYVPALFTEMQPLPRMNGRQGFFLDIQGHQTESLLVSHAAAIRSTALASTLERAMAQEWDAHFSRPISELPETEEMLTWFRQQAQGSRIAMLALQPPDWLTLEGLGDRTSLDGLLMRWLDSLPRGWLGIATYHPSYKLSRELEESIAEQMPNLLVLPEHWRQGRSEWLLQAVDAVVTVSSAIGFTALLAGKRVVASRASNLSGFAAHDISSLNEINPMCPEERLRLLAFLKERYCHPAERLLSEPGYLAKTASKITREGLAYYFDHHEPRSVIPRLQMNVRLPRALSKFLPQRY